MSVYIEAPRVNANEDQLQVIDIRVSQGQTVEQGDVAFVLETTKAAIEVAAPRTGVIGSLTIRVGDFVAVGSALCEITVSGESARIAGTHAFETVNQQLTVTAKARKLAAELGVNIDNVVPANGRIGEAEVRLAASCHKKSVSKPHEAQNRVSRTSNTRRAIIIGGGGHAACLIDALQGSGYDIIGCTDQNLPVGHHVCAGILVIGNEDVLEHLRSDGVHFAFVGIGGAQSSLTRRAMYERALALGFIAPTVIHPSAVVSIGTMVGSGCHILAGATVGPRCTIGNNVLVNQGSILCHDSFVEDHAHLTPGAILAGGVSVGSMTVVGMGATVLFGVKIGTNSLIHNGAHITSEVADNTVVDSRGLRSLIKIN
jgi:sugar O-acyltransferase (sialic acid O-acetyltransferase NeuD family)